MGKDGKAREGSPQQCQALCFAAFIHQVLVCTRKGVNGRCGGRMHDKERRIDELVVSPKHIQGRLFGSFSVEERLSPEPRRHVTERHAIPSSIPTALHPAAWYHVSTRHGTERRCGTATGTLPSMSEFVPKAWNRGEGMSRIRMGAGLLSTSPPGSATICVSSEHCIACVLRSEDATCAVLCVLEYHHLPFTLSEAPKWTADCSKGRKMEAKPVLHLSRLSELAPTQAQCLAQSRKRARGTAAPAQKERVDTSR